MSDHENELVIRVIGRLFYIALSITMSLALWIGAHQLYGAAGPWHGNGAMIFASAAAIHGFFTGFFFGVRGIMYVITAWMVQVAYLHWTTGGSVFFPALLIFICFTLINGIFWLGGSTYFYGIKLVREEKAAD
jgi:hypothetical protein